MNIQVKKISKFPKREREREREKEREKENHSPSPFRHFNILFKGVSKRLVKLKKITNIN